MIPVFFLMRRRPPISTLFPYTTLFRSTCRPSPSRPTRSCAFVTGNAWSATTLRAPLPPLTKAAASSPWRSEEHTSELQSRRDLVCRLLLEKKKENTYTVNHYDNLFEHD